MVTRQMNNKAWLCLRCDTDSTNNMSCLSLQLPSLAAPHNGALWLQTPIPRHTLSIMHDPSTHIGLADGRWNPRVQQSRFGSDHHGQIEGGNTLLRSVFDLVSGENSAESESGNSSNIRVKTDWIKNRDLILGIVHHTLKKLLAKKCQRKINE